MNPKGNFKLFLDMLPSSSGGYYSRDEWTAEMTFSKLPETEWQERHCICSDFVSWQRCFVRSQPSFLLGFGLFFCSFSCSLSGRLFGLGSLIKQTLTVTSTMAV